MLGNNNTRFQRYLLPGFVFQSVLIGGGYATGRELVEFFLSYGPVAGLTGMIVATAIFSVALAVAFEIARAFHAYDYRHFLKILLGPAWVLFELVFIALLVLVVAVIGAASGEILSASLNLPTLVGTILLVGIIAILVFHGTPMIEKALASWSFVLYAGYITLIVWTISESAGTINDAFINYPSDRGAIWSGIRYAGYSMAVIPIILFVARHFENRRDAITAGILAGPLGMLPALFFFLAMVAYYPRITDMPVPITYILDDLDSFWFKTIIQIILFGTLIETGTALIHAINERISENFREWNKTMPRYLRSMVALAVLLIGILFAERFGLVNLIGKGYGYSTYAFLALITIPLLTRGIVLIRR